MPIASIHDDDTTGKCLQILELRENARLAQRKNWISDHRRGHRIQYLEKTRRALTCDCIISHHRCEDRQEYDQKPESTSMTETDSESIVETDSKPECEPGSGSDFTSDAGLHQRRLRRLAKRVCKTRCTFSSQA